MSPPRFQLPHHLTHIANTPLKPALEIYFSRSLGFTLVTLGILTVLLTGSVPLSSRLSSGASNPNFPPLPRAKDTPNT